MSTTTQFEGFAAYEKSGELKHFKYTPRPLGDEDIEIKIDFCGICGSDIHTIDSGWGPTTYPVIVGHEIVGTVVAKGPKVADMKVGDRVGVGAQCWACLENSCKNCSRGFDNCCPRGVFTYNARYADGALAYGGYATAVRVRHQYAFKIPDGLDPAAAAPLLCAGITTYAPLKRHGAGPGKKVAVLGIGGLGHLGLKWARALGAHVVALSSSSKKKDQCLALGAHEFLDMSDKAAVGKYKGEFDIILCCANPRNQDWGLYTDMLDVNGKLVLVAVPEEDLVIPPFALIMGQHNIVGSLIGAKGEIEEMLEFAAKHKIVAQVQIMPLDQCQKAVDLVRKGDVRFRYVLDVKKYRETKEKL
ncbi:hypothetical protein HK102_012159 [Quaeritorhiza haematococci]|nr:hypothetical protein HK102_012159 [Quaeritorhiza haematococci]